MQDFFVVADLQYSDRLLVVTDPLTDSEIINFFVIAGVEYEQPDLQF